MRFIFLLILLNGCVVTEETRLQLKPIKYAPEPKKPKGMLVFSKPIDLPDWYVKKYWSLIKNGKGHLIRETAFPVEIANNDI